MIFVEGVAETVAGDRDASCVSVVLGKLGARAVLVMELVVLSVWC